MSISKNARGNCAYLLRFWQEPSGSTHRPSVWRFMLQDPQTGERYGFASLELLVRHLHTQMNAQEQTDASFNSHTDETTAQNSIQDEQFRQSPDQGQAS